MKRVVNLKTEHKLKPGGGGLENETNAMRWSTQKASVINYYEFTETAKGHIKTESSEKRVRKKLV